MYFKVVRVLLQLTRSYSQPTGFLIRDEDDIDIFKKHNTLNNKVQQFLRCLHYLWLESIMLLFCSVFFTDKYLILSSILYTYCPNL
jgi:hypothetical protein